MKAESESDSEPERSDEDAREGVEDQQEEKNRSSEEDDDEDDDSELEVEEILDRRVRRSSSRLRSKREPEYLVKWKGYGDHEASWEPVSALFNCREAIQDFEARRAARGT